MNENNKHWSRIDAVCLVAILVSALLLRFPPYWPSYLSGDSSNYVKLAWSMRYAPHVDHLSGVMYSFGYPIFIYMVSFITNSFDNAAIAVSVFFGVLSPVLIYVLGRGMFGRKAGVTAGLGLALFQPHVAVSMQALSESTYIFWLLAAVWLLAGGLARPRPLYHYFITGAVFGFAFIIRPEVQVSLAAMLAVGLYLLWSRHRQSARRLAMVVVLLFAAFAAVNVPKVLWLHHATGNWMLDARKNFTVGSIGNYQDGLARHADYPELKHGLEESNYGISPRGELNYTEKRSFGRWLLENPGRRLSYYWRNLKVSLGNVTVPVAVLVLLSALSIVLGGKGVRQDSVFLAASFSPIIMVPFFYSIGGGSWYGRPEPAVAFAPILILLGSAGLWLALAKSKEVWKDKATTAIYTQLALLFVIWGLPAAKDWQLVRHWGEEAPRDEHIEMDMTTGVWLANNLPHGVKVMVRPWEIARYCNREREMLPYAEYPRVIEYARRKQVGYIVVGGAREWVRPQLDFLLPPNNKACSGRYSKDLDMVYDTEGVWKGSEVRPYYVAVYRVKPQPE